MIRRRFSIFRGIGPKTERSIWDAGVCDWRSYLEGQGLAGVSVTTRKKLDSQVSTWHDALERENTGFFVRHLPSVEHWLLYEVFGNGVRYLDIETTGFAAGREDVTVVGLYDGKHYDCLINGQGLSSLALQRNLRDCKLLVTFFGSGFDIPVLKRAFPDVDWNIPHFDLCFAGRRLGLRGGLKVIEKELGIGRSQSIEQLDGLEAIRLWRIYRSSGDQRALDKLIEYNRADTVNLLVLAEIMYTKLCQQLASN